MNKIKNILVEFVIKAILLNRYINIFIHCTKLVVINE